MESGQVYCSACASKSRYQVNACHINKATALLGRKWVLPILFELCLRRRQLRFNELQRFLFPITPKVLSKRLKEMEQEEVVERTEKTSEALPAVEYTLTAKGKELLQTIRQLSTWSEKWYGREGLRCPNAKRLACLKL